MAQHPQGPAAQCASKQGSQRGEGQGDRDPESTHGQLLGGPSWGFQPRSAPCWPLMDSGGQGGVWHLALGSGVGGEDLGGQCLCESGQARCLEGQAES